MNKIYITILVMIIWLFFLFSTLENCKRRELVNDGHLLVGAWNVIEASTPAQSSYDCTR